MHSPAGIQIPVKTAEGVRADKPAAGERERNPGAAAAAQDVYDYMGACGLGPRPGRRHVVRFPTTYSLMDDPESSLSSIAEVVACIGGGVRDLRYDQRHCTQVDICAESVTAVFAKQARAIGVTVDGDYPETEDARACVSAFGGPAVLEGFTPEPTPEVALLALERGFNTRSGRRPVDWERIALRAEQVPLLLSNRLGQDELTPEFLERFAKFLGEVIGNASEHGQRDWWIACSWRKAPSAHAEPVGRCQLVVFNLGETIEQSVAKMPAHPLRKDCERILAHHEEQGYYNEGWTREAGWTLLALQHGVSRFGGRGERGAGTIEMLRFFDYLARSSSTGARPRMALLSGRTHILLDGRYRLPAEPGRDGKYVIAFNPPNDLRYPPNPAVIRNLGRCFPGTLVSLHFHICKDHLQPIANHHGDELAPKGGGG